MSTLKCLQKTVDKINHIILRKKLSLPLEKTGDKGTSRTETFDNKNTKSKFKSKHGFSNVENQERKK